MIFGIFYAVCAVIGYVGLIAIAPRRARELYALPAAGTLAIILTLLALAATLYR